MKKLYRTPSGGDRLVSGVLGGIAEYLKVDTTIVRLIVAGILIFIPWSLFSFLIAYVIAAIIIPVDPSGYEDEYFEDEFVPDEEETDYPIHEEKEEEVEAVEKGESWEFEPVIDENEEFVIEGQDYEHTNEGTEIQEVKEQEPIEPESAVVPPFYKANTRQKRSNKSE